MLFYFRLPEDEDQLMCLMVCLVWKRCGRHVVGGCPVDEDRLIMSLINEDVRTSDVAVTYVPCVSAPERVQSRHQLGIAS